jgi:hypothetical protein
MRTGKISLKGYLYSINRAESPKCECNTSNQTLTHILEECPLYRKQRKRYLDHYVLRDSRIILSDRRTAQQAAKFMISTGLLDQFRYLS